MNSGPKVFNLQFQGLNFGDGTGFVSTAGEPVDIHRKSGACRRRDSERRASETLKSDRRFHAFACAASESVSGWRQMSDTSLRSSAYTINLNGVDKLHLEASTCNRVCNEHF